MWKKIIISFFICSFILAIGTTSHATGGINNNLIKNAIELNIQEKVTQTNIKIEDKKIEVDMSKYQLTSPEKESYTSMDKIALINGKAPSGTLITIKIYGTTDLTRKVFNLYKLPTEEDYIEIHLEEMNVGNMGFFDCQLELVTGINRIVLNFNVEGIPTKEIIIFVEPKSTRVNKEVKLTDIMTLIR